MVDITEVQKRRIIRYFGKDFDSLKKDLVEHLKVYFPDVYQDFNEASIGVMLTELMAFIGDNLSFYLDKKFAETFTDTAKEPRNVWRHAKQKGFKPFGKSSASGKISGFIKVPARSVNGEIIPDMRYAGTVKKGAKLKSKTGKTFETLVDIDFSDVDISDNTAVAVGDRDATTKQPTTFVLRVNDIDIKAGETKSTTFTIGAYEAFKKLTLTDDDVLEVISCRDSSNNIWYEVDYLAQDTVFDSVANTGDDTSDVPFILKLRSVPFRFITEYNVETGKTSLIFGTGDAQKFDGELVPNIGDLSIPLLGKETFTDFVIDPQNFLKTRTLGLAPSSTTLTVRYRVGGGLDTNAGSKEIDTVSESTFATGDSTLALATIKEVAGSFSVINESPIRGGLDELSIDEIKHLTAAFFAAQSRAVTAEDFIVRTLSMPSRFGAVFRAHAKVNFLNKNAVELITLSQNAAGYVVEAPDSLKTNLKTYLSRFRMLTDAIEILDGEIINLAVSFSLLTNPDFNKSEVLGACLSELANIFKIKKWQINQPIVKSQILTVLQQVPGVDSVYDLNFLNRVGTFENRSYSSTTHNIEANTKNGILYCKDNAIFEVKYPLRDIIGTAK